MRLIRTMRWRLQVWHGLMLTVLTAALLAVFWRMEAQRALAEVDARLAMLAPAAMGPSRSQPPPPRPRPEDEFEPPPPPSRSGPPPEVRRRDEQMLREAEARGVLWAFWQAESSVPIAASPGGAEAHPRPGKPPERGMMVNATIGNRRVMHRSAAERSVLVISAPLDAMHEALRRLAWQLSAAGCAVIAAGLLGGWWIARRALRPVQVIGETADHIAGGDLSRRIVTAGMDEELAQLAAVLNSSFARLEAAFAQQGRFTADASHELRTPVAIIHTPADARPAA
jgi:two-component system, OmpR family, sensor kinase